MANSKPVPKPQSNREGKDKPLPPREKQTEQEKASYGQEP